MDKVDTVTLFILNASSTHCMVVRSSRASPTREVVKANFIRVPVQRSGCEVMIFQEQERHQILLEAASCWSCRRTARSSKGKGFVGKTASDSI
jgi:hypothetical protein